VKRFARYLANSLKLFLRGVPNIIRVGSKKKVYRNPVWGIPMIEKLGIIKMDIFWMSVDTYGILS
jgi:hypothetical protein